MNKIKTIKIKNQDDTLSEETYTIAADAINIDMKNKNNLQEVIGDINAKQEGSIEEQLKDKVDKNSIENSLDSSRTDKVLSAKQGKILGDTLNKKTYYCKTIAEMVADNKLKNGDLVITEGYYSANDDGAAEYLIRNIKSDDVNDGGSIHFLNNNLVAELIVKDYITPEMFGAKGDGVHNDTLPLQKACDTEKSIKTNGKIYLVSREIEIKSTFIMDNFSRIKADNNFLDEVVVSITKDTQRRNLEYYINVDSNNIAKYGICVGKPRFCKLFLNVVNAGENGIDCDHYEGNGNGGNTFNCTVVGNRSGGTTEKGIIVNCWDSIFNLIVTQDCKIGVYLNVGELIAENVHCWLSDYGAQRFWDESYCIYDTSYYRIIVNWFYQDSVKYGIGGKGPHGLIRYFEYMKNLSNDDLYNDEKNLTCSEGSVRLTIDKFLNAKNEHGLLKYSLNQSNSHEFGVTQKNGTISSKNILQNETPFTDMNDMPQWGTYYVKYNTLNLPLDQGGVVKSEIIGNCVIQTYYSASVFINYGRYYKRVRQVESDTWSNWFEYRSTSES